MLEIESVGVTVTLNDACDPGQGERGMAHLFVIVPDKT